MTRPARPASQVLAETTFAMNAWVELDLDALANNVAVIRREIGPGLDLIAVVKANAYGHGVRGIAPALEALGVERFAVVWVHEGVALRALGITRPIVVLGHAFPEDAETAVRHQLTLTCHSAALGDALSRAAQQVGARAAVHIKVDTGLHRFGVEPEQAVALADHLRRFPALDVEGISTHMANADEVDDSFADTQREAFEAVCRRLPWIPYRHAANSATALRRPGLRYSGVRCGLALHGVSPPNTPAPGLRPVLSLKARLARVAEVPAGDGVSYGLTWRASRPSRVALIPVGYADGWHRALSGRAEVLVGGRRCTVAGRIAMDQFLVDVTDVPEAREGDEAVLIGAQGQARITVDEVAAHAGTISWEVLAALGARLPRVFHKGGIVQSVIGPA